MDKLAIQLAALSKMQGSFNEIFIKDKKGDEVAALKAHIKLLEEQNAALRKQVEKMQEISSIQVRGENGDD